ncbi:hypothetical protein [Prauserella marina]|uniref:hypothetical protein n=1 Tax=Prauserella marina TaxID=530584 RepID=UPI00115FC5C0|nr:hypothetical protein [Prauserella marina]
MSELVGDLPSSQTRFVKAGASGARSASASLAPAEPARGVRLTPVPAHRPEPRQAEDSKRALNKKKNMSSPDGQVSGMAGKQRTLRSAGGPGRAIPTTSRRAITPRQGGKPGSARAGAEEGCPLDAA